jgi:crotonobetainyl-CoA:carnitine CoA-transferase CaiB-like acyl-CoA transferase
MISVSVRGTAAGEAVIIPYYTRTKLSIVTRVAACSSSGWGAPRIQGPAPRIGEHSAAILAELGLNAAEIERLAAEKVVRLVNT